MKIKIKKCQIKRSAREWVSMYECMKWFYILPTAFKKNAERTINDITEWSKICFKNILYTNIILRNTMKLILIM